MNGHVEENGNVNKENGHSKGNEDKKIFVGGIAYDVTNEDLTSHFGEFGEVANAQVKFDRATGRSRGFAFVEFTTGEACKAALAAREQTIKGKTVEVKPAKSRENKKVFVGGLPSDYSETELRSHFEQFGKVEDIEWPFDKQTKTRRNFAFIVFEEEDAADKASAQTKQTFGSRECDVKKAVPQGKRFAIGGGRGNGMGRFPGRGGAHGGANWYGWGQMGAVPYGGGAWQSDWYNAASAFYGGGAGQNGYSSSGAYGGGNYDYPSTHRNPGTAGQQHNQHHQQQRYHQQPQQQQQQQY